MRRCIVEYTSRVRENAAIAQSVERILGKDEVPSSNLGSSFRDHRNLQISVVFLCFPNILEYKLYSVLLNCAQMVTQMVTSGWGQMVFLANISLIDIRNLEPNSLVLTFYHELVSNFM